MNKLKLIVKITIYIALLFYVFNFLANLALTRSHYFSVSDFILILLTASLSILLLKSKLFEVSENISWLKIFLVHIALFIIFGIPIVWYDLHTSSWFQGVASIAYGVIVGILALITSTLFYILQKSLTLKRFAILPLILYCLVILYMFIATTGSWFDVLYLLDNRVNPPQLQYEVIKDVN